MSAAIGRHPAYLGYVFHQEVGSSAREYLTRVRLEHAAELIRDGVKIESGCNNRVILETPGDTGPLFIEAPSDTLGKMKQVPFRGVRMD